MPGSIYSVDRICLWVYYDKIPIYPIFYLLKGDYRCWDSLHCAKPPPKDPAHNRQETGASANTAQWSIWRLRVLGFRVSGFWGLGIWGLGLRVSGFRVT